MLKINSNIKSNFLKSLNNAIISGISGSKAIAFDIVSLMWIKAVLNYQYKYDTSFLKTIKTLYKEGGIKRFYSGVQFALIDGPLLKFIDTFSNNLIINLPINCNIPIFYKTIFSTFISTTFRVLLSPFNNIKTIYQIEGKNSKKIIKNKIKKFGILSFYDGYSSIILGSFINRFPWFVTHNYLEKIIPKSKNNLIYNTLIRNGTIGFLSSLNSSLCSNFTKVLKINKQTYDKKISMYQLAKIIIKKSGYKGLFLRGMKTRILINGIQDILFNILWKYFRNKYIIKDSIKNGKWLIDLNKLI